MTIQEQYKYNIDVYHQYETMIRRFENSNEDPSQILDLIAEQKKYFRLANEAKRTLEEMSFA